MKSFDEWYKEAKKSNDDGFSAKDFFEAGQQSKQAEVDELIDTIKTSAESEMYLFDELQKVKGERDELQKRLTMYEREGYKLVPVEPSEELSDKLESMASCQPSYDGVDIYRVAIGELDYDWKTGTKAMIGVINE
jgi:hypothetical protein